MLVLVARILLDAGWLTCGSVLIQHLAVLFMQVFIMGYGNIGIELAKRLCPFGVKVNATKRKWVSDNKVSSLTNGMRGFVHCISFGLRRES